MAGANGRWYKRNCGYVSCTFYFNKSETRDIMNLHYGVLGAVTSITGPIGGTLLALTASVAETAINHGGCLKLKVGARYTTPDHLYVLSWYRGSADGCR